MACFVMIRPQTWQEIRNNDQIVTCSSCGRILYFDPANEAPAPEPPKKKAKPRAAETEDQAEVEAVPEPEITPAP